MNIQTINNRQVMIWTDYVEESAMRQIENLTTLPFLFHHLAIMPDVHAGMGMPIGGVLACKDAVIPNAVGVDIGCGMCAVKTNFKVSEIPADVLRKKIMRGIRKRIPLGMEHQKEAQDEKYLPQGHDLDKLTIVKERQKPILREVGTLGGGNHFIEVDKGEEGYYIIIHSGSRHLGYDVADYYTETARRRLANMGKEVPYEMSFVEGSLMDDYLHDVEITTKYASLNREIILSEILKGMKWKKIECYESIHNYIGILPDGTKILRKGAASACEGEKVIIPINMRDGVILGVGKGNPDWNYSAPHGSGRVLRRDEVKNHYTVSAFKNDMKGIYSSSISSGTLDEAPVAYRGIDEIKDVISDSVEVNEIVKPVYNFKAGKER